MSTNLPQKNGLAVSWSTNAGEGVACLRATALRHQYGRHCHNAYAIGVIESGVGGNRCRGGDHYTPAGSIVAMNPGETHTGYAVGDRSLSYRMFYIPTATLQATLPEGAAAPYFSALCIENPRWATQLLQLHRCLEVADDPLEMQARFHDLMGRFTARFGCDNRLMPEATGDEPHAVAQVKAYLHAHYEEPVTIEALANLTKLNRAYLIRVFTRTVGMPPYTYLTQIRVERAKSYLAAGHPPADTALAVGFADQSHLNRHFKKLTGTTPRLYRLGHCVPVRRG